MCAKQIDLLTECSTRFQEQYDEDAKCIDEQRNSVPQMNFSGPWFIACYVGLSLLTIFMLIWCAWNQRWSSVLGSTVPLESHLMGKKWEGPMIGAKKRTDILHDKNKSKMSDNERQWTQTGYKSTVVGMTLYSLIILAHWIIQLLLFALTIEYCEYLDFYRPSC